MRKYNVYSSFNKEKIGEFLGIETTNEGVKIWYLTSDRIIRSGLRAEVFLNKPND